MFSTTQMLIASLIIIAIVLGIFGYVFYSMQGPTVPEPPVEVYASLNISCTTKTMNFGNGFYQSVITSMRTYLDFGVKNHLSTPVTIDRIYPIGINITNLGVKTMMGVKPYEYMNREMQVDWLNMSDLVTRAYPGDVFKLSGGVLERVVSGEISVYYGMLPTTQPGSSYICPFKGREHYNVTVSGSKMSAEIGTPGCAPVYVSRGVDSQNVFVLGEFSPEKYYYSDYDIPFYLHLYENDGVDRLGFYYLPATGISLLDGTGAITGEKPYYFAYYLNTEDDVEKLTVGSSTTTELERTIAPTSVRYVVMGLARERPAKFAPPIKICAYYSPWSSSHHCVYIDLADYTFKIVKYSGGTEKVVKSGNIVVAKDGDYISPALRDDGVVVYFKPKKDFDKDYYAYIRANGPGGNSIINWKVYMPANPDAELDMVVVWEDLVGYYPPGSSKIDGNGDEWIHVVYLKNGTWIVTGYRAAGGFKHVFYIANKVIFVKNYGVSWSNTVRVGQYIIMYPYKAKFFPVKYYYPFEIAPLESTVNFIGVYSGDTITVAGLFPGDKILLATPSKTVSLPANNTVETIPLLKFFSPKDLVEAMENGGIYLAIQPSSQHILSLLPAKALVHVKSKTVDKWVEVPLLITPHCTLTAGFTSYGIISIVRDGDLYKVYAKIPGFNNLLFLGVYPKVIIKNLQNYEIDVTYEDGSTMTIKPGSHVMIGDTPVSFYNYAGLMLISNKPAYFTGGTMIQDTKSFKSLTIKGIMTIEMSLSK